MVSVQYERLQKDSAQLEQFIHDLVKSGDHQRAEKIIAKKEYLDNRLAEIAA